MTLSPGRAGCHALSLGMRWPPGGDWRPAEVQNPCLSALLAAMGYMTLHCWLPCTVSGPPRGTKGLHSLSADAVTQGQA